MSSVNKCNIPEDLYYLVEKHVWAKLEGDIVIVGLTDVAQNLARTIISASLKAAGKRVKKGKSIATVESGKWVGPVPSPVNGEILEINQVLATTPSMINHDPYGEGWVAKIKFDDWDADCVDLVTGQDALRSYKEFLDAEGISCEPIAHEG